ncbi:MAG: serine/threonine-protein kinase [Pseudomonadota bacterium]
MTTAQPDQAFPIPFGKYLLTELLAVGGMAEVYRAKIFGVDGFEKEMVVKKILPKYAQKASFVQMFVDEAKIAVALTHGNIVPIYELGEFGGAYYIAMEYVEGPTVLDVLRDCFTHGKALPAPYCLYVAAEVAKGLGYAHGKAGADGKGLGIVHRDINPRNIVITPAGEVKILDFGIARASTRRHQTASGVIKGTPGYMSPEQLFGFSVDHRSDIYCLGIILHELLTVRRLFRVRDVATMRMLVEQGAVQPPSAYRAELGVRLDGLLELMLSLKPEDRYQNAQELEEALRREVAVSGMSVTGRGLSDLVRAIQNPEAREVAPLDKLGSMPEPAISRGASTTAHGPAPGRSLPPSVATDGAPAPEDQVQSKELFEAPPRAPRPRPMTAVPAAGAPHSEVLKTSVLAQNDEINWASLIGDDAELLAIANASGLKPRSVGRTLALPLIVVLIVLGALAVVGREQIPLLWRRIVEQRPVRVGSIIIKTFPSGAEVRVDGKKHGLTPLRVDNVDIDVEHTLLVAPVGEPEVRRFVGPGDWGDKDGQMQVEVRIGYDKLPAGQKLIDVD